MNKKKLKGLKKKTYTAFYPHLEQSNSRRYPDGKRQ
jgi:hypothetical protein